MTHPVPPSMDVLVDRVDFDCGCVIGSYMQAAVMYPCKPTCGRYQFALREAAAQEKPIQFDSDIDNA